MTDHTVIVHRLAGALVLARRECDALTDTQRRLFPGGAPVTVDWLAGIPASPGRGDLVEAFAARFARFQDGLGAKVLPTLLQALGEPKGPLLDNLDRAHRFGWIGDPQDWLTARALRNRLVHEYVPGMVELAEALNAAAPHVDRLIEAFRRMAATAARRGWAPTDA